MKKIKNLIKLLRSIKRVMPIVTEIETLITLSKSPKERCSGEFRGLGFKLQYEPYEKVLWYTLDYIATIKLEGDYLEFGTWRGRSLTSAYHFAQSYKKDDMKFYGFDSFQGLPEIETLDQYNDEYHKGEYACSLSELKKILKKNEVDLSKCKFIEGYYEDSLTLKTKKELKIKQAAVITIDCDLYESTKLALDFSTDYIVSGTVIIFDDWFCFRNSPHHGEQRAFLEWLDKNPQFHASDFSIHPTIKAFVMYKEENNEAKNYSKAYL